MKKIEKDKNRLKDLKDLRKGVPGEKIARRNAWISPESCKRARIIFA